MDDLLRSQVSNEHSASYFSSLSINPQGQLCLSLNRRLLFATSIEEVLTLGCTYGSSIIGTPLSVASDVTSAKHCQFSLIHYSAQEGFTHTPHSGYHSKEVVSSNAFSNQKQTETHTVKTRSLDLSEGRSLLVLGLLRKLLETCGHSVSCYTNNIPQVSLLPPPLTHTHTYDLSFYLRLKSMIPVILCGIS